jgi:hypothetical protein
MERSTFRQAVARWSRCPPEELAARLEDALRNDPRCPVVRYLAACQCFDRGRSALAVRHMMVAYRAAPDLQSAALLVFAGLNWTGRRGAKFLPVLLDTWEEFRRPEFDRRRGERLLLDAFAEPEPQPGLAPLGPVAQRLWRLPIRTLRAQLREAALSGNTALHPLLTAHA